MLTTDTDKSMLEWVVLETNKVLRKWKAIQDPKLQATDNLKSVALNFLQRGIKHHSSPGDTNYRKWQIIVSGGRPMVYFNLDIPCVSGIHFPGPMYHFEKPTPNASVAWNKLADSLDYTQLADIKETPLQIDLDSIRNIKF